MAKETRNVGAAQVTVEFSNGTRLEVAPFAGTATQWRGGPKGLRAARLPADRDVSLGFEAALAEVGMTEQETIHLDVVAGKPALRSMSRQAAAVDRVVLRPAPPPRDAVQVVWYQDESGGVSWHFPDGFLERAATEATAAARRRTTAAVAGAVFTIPTRTAGARRAFETGQPSTRLRGPVVKLGRKIFKVLLVPLSRAIARPLEAIVGKVERRHRQERVRAVAADDYRLPVREPFTGWAALDGRRSLLVVHGIFSTTQGMLSGFPRPAMERLIAHYGGRVIALDQLTVSHGPEENAAGFLRAAKAARPEGRFELDVLCHSRGGIVARTLVERGRALVPEHNCSFDRVFFVATPNAGSPLGDARHMVDMIDVFTNLLTNFPDGPVLYSLEILLAIVKLISHAAETRLPGLAAMGTQGYIKEVLNAGPAPSPRPRYAAAAADYEPAPGDNGWLNGRLADSVIDRVFRRGANDLVVPRDGVYADNGHPLFPIADPVTYAAADHVWHTDFFRHPRTLEAIFDHFGVPSPAAVGREEAAVEEEEEVEELWPAEVAEEEALAGPYEAPAWEKDVDAMAEELLGGFRGGGAGARRGGYDAGGGRRDRRPGPFARPNGGGGARPGRHRAAAEPPPRRRRTLGGGASGRRGRRGTRGTGAVPSAATPAAPAPATAAPAERIERRPEIDFHEQVESGATHELTVRLADLAPDAAAGGRIAIDLAAGEESAELAVRLHAPGFDVAPDPVETMTVHRVRDPASEEVRFQLTAHDPGNAPLRREITAEFWLGNGLIGAVTHYTFVVPKGQHGPSDGHTANQAFALPPVRRQDCDLVLMIEGRNQPGQAPFRVSLRCEIPGHEVAALNCGLMNLPQEDLGAYVHSALDKTIGRYPDGAGLSEAEYVAELARWEEEFRNRLDDLGKQLWTFLPEGFHREYFRLYRAGAAPASILVHSDEMLFPWELVIPSDTSGGRYEELPPLGVSHVLGRWKPALRMKPSPQRLRVEKFVVLNPAYPEPDALPWTVAEVHALTKLLPKIEVFKPSTAARIRRDLLGRGDVRLLHFSGHGTFDAANADLSELLLEDRSALDAMAIARTRLGTEASPFVYLNACSVGAAGVTVGRAGGFAAACLDGGFSGVIAPYWPINDERAAQFSVALYQKLQAGRAVGEALRELREEADADTTPRAYAFFGDPWTRLSFDDLV